MLQMTACANLGTFRTLHLLQTLYITASVGLGNASSAVDDNACWSWKTLHAAV